MQDKLYAFWKYDRPPYLLGGEVEEVKDNMVRVKGYTGWFRTVKIVPLEKGIKLQKKLNKAKAKYMKITQQADNELRETVKEISE